MSCRQRPEYRRITSSLTRQVGDFKVAIGGGVWVAAGGHARQLRVRRTLLSGKPHRPVHHGPIYKSLLRIDSQHLVRK